MVEATRVSWNPDLETGIKAVDEQHRQYFKLVNSYLDHTAEDPADPQQVLGLAEKFDFLRRYAMEHFSMEESIMEQAGYPGLKVHREQHLHFLERVEEFHSRMQNKGFSPELAREVNYYIVEWFIEHIRVRDMIMVEFLNERPASGSQRLRFLKKLVTRLGRKN